MELYEPKSLNLTKYLFYTGKGGVGKTTVASATAAHLADAGYKVTLVSTDPASNLQDVFETELTNKPTPVPSIENLKVANFDPDTAVSEYIEKSVGPYRGILPQEAIDNMEEQLSGSCTQEVASFNEFAYFLTDKNVEAENDYVIFDTAPTGHTLRMLELPSAWTNFFDENTTGASCMGQLSGLTDEQARIKEAMAVLNDSTKTTLFLVARPQRAAITEADRAAEELNDLGIKNQQLIVNGLLEEPTDKVSQTYYDLQQEDFSKISDKLNAYTTYYVPLRPYNVTGLDKLRILLGKEQPETDVSTHQLTSVNIPNIEGLIDDLIAKDKHIIFTMGKGGVGKTTAAVKIAEALAERGKNVRLATTDPADHLHFYLKEAHDMKVDHIDEEAELERYSNEVLDKARETMDEDDLDYIKEDLRSPCTKEIAVFKRFAEIVNYASEDETVVIDTAPTGHTLLLLQSSQAYNKEIERSAGEAEAAIEQLLPRLQDEKETEVVMVTLAETTPVYETLRLADDLGRAEIPHNWWLVNQSMVATGTTNSILQARAANEVEWINYIDKLTEGNYVLVEWKPEKFEELLEV